ncbi:MAG TPA: hypothetical protein VMW15_11695 [Terracidiphilus sp.]|nr:hypothetical protein [Terracidiphilus sp.]
MTRRSGNQSVFNAGAQGIYSTALEAIDALYKRETQANLAALRERHRRKQLKQSIASWIELWPVALGIILSYFTPQLREIVAPFGRWGMWIVFPLEALSERPELYMGYKVAMFLPTLMFYAQYPLEGLLAKTILKGNMTIPRVMVEVAYFHALCVVELWLVSGGLWHLFR